MMTVMVDNYEDDLEDDDEVAMKDVFGICKQNRTEQVR